MRKKPASRPRRKTTFANVLKRMSRARLPISSGVRNLM